MNLRCSKIYFGLLLWLSLVSCSVLSSVDNTKHMYLLDISTTTQPLPPKNHGKTLLVSMPQAAPGFSSANMVYLREPYLLEYYSKSHWIDTPARMLLPILVHKLEFSGQFASVLSVVTAPVVGDLRLDTEIIKLQQEFFVKPSRVSVTLRAQLLDIQARQVVATQVFEVSEESPSEDAAGGMMATHRAVEKIFRQLPEFTAKHS
ncbi:MAG: ABC-type transport auxiliary lipoprotein family protein [Thiotrichaceae bacterium]